MLLLTLISVSTYILFHTTAHFVLQSPPSLGFNDALEATYPCGSFDITKRDNITSYPLGGYPFHLLSTHTKSTFKYRAALASDTESWVDLIAAVSQEGVGDFCLPAVPGPGEWQGKDAVVQVAQYGPDGILYQCAAVAFVTGAAFPADSSCKNSSGVSASFTSITQTLPSGTPVTAFSSSTAAASGNATRSVVGATSTSVPTSSSPTPTKISGDVREIGLKGPWFWLFGGAVLGACLCLL